MTSDELSQEDRVTRGEEIARFLENPHILAVLNGMDNAYYQRWKQVTTVEDRENLRAEARAFETFAAAIRGFVDDGLTAKHQLEQRYKA
jgi:hypothetical protein